MAGILSSFGQGGGYSASASASVANTNRSLNFNGPSGGGGYDGIGALIGIANGNPANGGTLFTGEQNFGGLVRGGGGLSGALPLLLIGGIALVAVFALTRK